MKRTLAVVLVIIALALATLFILLFGGDRPPVRLVEMSFLEFTNTPAGPSARFAVHFLPRFGGCAWPQFEASRQVDGAWKPWSPGGQRRTHEFFDSSYPRPLGRDGKRIDCVLALPVANTNDAWRFVVAVSEAPPGPRPLMLRARAWWYSVRRIPPPSVRTEYVNNYFITNETRANKRN